MTAATEYRNPAPQLEDSENHNERLGGPDNISNSRDNSLHIPGLSEIKSYLQALDPNAGLDKCFPGLWDNPVGPQSKVAEFFAARCERSEMNPAEVSGESINAPWWAAAAAIVSTRGRGLYRKARGVPSGAPARSAKNARPAPAMSREKTWQCVTIDRQKIWLEMYPQDFSLFKILLERNYLSGSDGLWKEYSMNREYKFAVKETVERFNRALSHARLKPDGPEVAIGVVGPRQNGLLAAVKQNGFGKEAFLAFQRVVNWPPKPKVD